MARRYEVCAIAWLALLSVLPVACGGSDSAAARKPKQSALSTPAAETELVVFAASSLKEAFGTLAAQLETTQPSVKVTFNFAGSQELRTQLEQGARADVFASADLKHMNELVKAKRAQTPAVFARNELVIVVAKEQAATLLTVSDLTKAEKIVIGAPEVPVGRYTGQFFEKAAASLGADFVAKVQAQVVSRELNVKQVLAKVTLGEAGAGIVYRSDVSGLQSGVGVVTIPPELNAIAQYPIAVLSDAPHPKLAQAWVDLVRSEAGQEALRQAGFLAAQQSVAAP